MKTYLMKNIYSLFILLFLSLTGFSKNYFIYTAKRSGDWSNAGTWTTAPRNDNVQKDKFIIPASYTVIGDDDVNSMGFTDVEMQIHGILKLAPSTTLHFGTHSRIEVFATGAIDANGASQQIYIGSVSKYTGNKNKNLQGPVYADASTGSAPNGFTAYALLPANITAFSATISNEQTVFLKWSAATAITNTHFQVEQKVDGSDWTLLGVVVAGDNGETKSFKFSHTISSSGTLAYRLKQVGDDGKIGYSNVVSVIARQPSTVPPASIFAVNKTINIDLPMEVKTPVEVKIMSMNGYIMNSKTFKPSKKISFSAENLKRGAYLVYVSDNVNKETIRKIFIN
jgi:hypothetical protein